MLQEGLQIGDAKVRVGAGLERLELFAQLGDIHLAQIPAPATLDDLVFRLELPGLEGFGLIHHHAFVQQFGHPLGDLRGVKNSPPPWPSDSANSPRKYS